LSADRRCDAHNNYARGEIHDPNRNTNRTQRTQTTFIVCTHLSRKQAESQIGTTTPRHTYTTQTHPRTNTHRQTEHKCICSTRKNTQTTHTQTPLHLRAIFRTSSAGRRIRIRRNQFCRHLQMLCNVQSHAILCGLHRASEMPGSAQHAVPQTPFTQTTTGARHIVHMCGPACRPVIHFHGFA
jgi:hypothetical protein